MWHGEIVSSWGVNTEGMNVPRVVLDHPFIQMGERWSEGEGDYGSGQGTNPPPLDPDLCIVYACFTAEHMDAVLADKDYGEGAFLWLEEIAEDEDA